MTTSSFSLVSRSLIPTVETASTSILGSISRRARIPRELGMPSSLAAAGPHGDGLAQSFQKPFQLGLAMLHPRHALP